MMADFDVPGQPDQNLASRRLLYVVTPAHYFISHRLALARAAQAEGWQVHVAVPPGRDAEEIVSLGFRVHSIPLQRSFAFPWQELRSVLALLRLHKQIQPSLVHAISPKAAVLGGLAAWIAGSALVMTKGGLGRTITETGFRYRFARFVIRNCIRMVACSGSRIIVQNADELKELARSRAVRARAVLIQGAGIDCAQFAPSAEPPGPVVVLLAARLLRQKGIEEFVEAARMVRSRRIDATFLLAGRLDDVPPVAITRERLAQWTAEGVVHWLGHSNDMPSLFSQSHIVCLPSYGEGLPKVLAEAAAAGRPIVATDAPGCRDVVSHGVNGLLVPMRDSGALAAALETLIMDRNLRLRFGKAGRAIARERFDVRDIVRQTLSVYGAAVAEKCDAQRASVTAYFHRTYPQRAGLASRLFRHGEVARRRIVQLWVPDVTGLSILDAGCGDGKFLISVLRGRPAMLRVEDMVASNVDAARTVLEHHADRFEGATCDSTTEALGDFDLVMAVGLLDYQQDWQGVLMRLVQRSARTVIVSIPRGDHLRNRLRLPWLVCNGIRLTMMERQCLNDTLDNLGLTFDLHATDLEWFVRVCKV
jgi:glycosyltransferase involved in cell wall biosynthesis